MPNQLTECWQVNLQRHFGGGEVYTAFLCKALDKLGITTRLFHHRDAVFWKNLQLPASTILHSLSDITDLTAALPKQRGWVLCHGPLPESTAKKIAGHHLLTSIAHMPPQGRSNDRYLYFHHVFGVSAYVVQGLRATGAKVWDTPLYGVSDLRKISGSEPIRQTSCYDWDLRKGRERLLGLVEPLIEPLRTRPTFSPQPGVTLGIVSRLTPIKQFPKLFEIIAPIIAARPNFRLEIFGSGGYTSVRDLRDATRSLGPRVRLWGQQKNVAAVYQHIDYLLSGLPEKEALGLNIIEAQACDTPVIAVDAPPFTETVLDGITGYLYQDPRTDNGEGFAALLDRIADGKDRLHPMEAHQHLARFTFDAFTTRLEPIVATIRLQYQTENVQSA